MPRGGPRPGGGRPKGSRDTRKRLPQSLRDWAQAEFDRQFRAGWQDVLDALRRLSTGTMADPQVVRYVADRVLGKQGPVMELPAGGGVQSVEITYRVVAQDQDARG